ncbi:MULTISPECIES: hypothetical protein [unclassified Tolypothrix]|uniref:hypothetical protein n=1 Tax=unclassified Tolypothrix TaxID=2649714 RepID=UPI0005EAB1AC|nr:MULTISPECIES: hypothetical protein [unclassified Tolypothrix]BAY95673.1 hypothetical protein NIES3275_77500 [Microchaete diplosiphon NIES-3275]EKE96369.1 hypothetical protein FDUTEX481_03492 [Tolypothrix sp. PCC 7601]MBE9083499.1 hypothetical protein [Tolypothrix sp. LEGE 11397]UYD30893.1 hypothetical protein HGR01_39095 [Tolypothrix sp. PCC 7712]UYD38550.1 hypothetical protein HG267_39365 [Tolypothrix sp. PCC 7601]
MNRTVKLKLDAPITYAALHSLSGISQETVFQALDGNQTAAATVADFRIKQTQRAQNAKAVFGNLSLGLQATETVMAEETQFLTAAGTSINKMAEGWSKVRVSDTRLGYGLQQKVIASDNQLAQEQFRHSRTLNLLGESHRATLRTIEIDATKAQTQLWQQVKDKQQGLSPADRAKETLKDIHRHGSNAVNRAKGFFRRLLD